MRTRLNSVLALVFIALILFPVSCLGSGARTGTSLTSREIIDGHFANQQEVLAALVNSESLPYVSDITFHGIDVQLGASGATLQGFPIDGTDYVALTSGLVNDIPGEATTFISTDVNGIDISGGSPDGLNAYDVATLTVQLDLTAVKASDNPKLVFYFKFMSEEVPTYVGSGFQDFFTARAYDASGEVVADIARLPDGNPFTIDNAWQLMNQVQGGSQSPQPPYPDPNDVAFNGCTDVRPVEFGLSALAGQVCTIEFQIGDVGDALYDSAVFLDGLSLELEGGGGEDRVDLGLVVVYGDNVVELQPNLFRVQGNVHINDVMRFDGNLEVNTLTKTITGNCRVLFDDPEEGKKLPTPELLISDTAVEFYIDASVSPVQFHFSAGFAELGFQVAGITLLADDLRLYFNDPTYGHGLKGDVYLRIANMEAGQGGPQGELLVQGLYATSLMGIGFEQGKIHVQNVRLHGGFKVEDLLLDYVSATDTFTMDAKLCVPYWHSTIEGGFQLVQGALESVTLGFEHSTGLLILPFPPPPIPYMPNALYLQGIHGTLAGISTSAPYLQDTGLGLTLGPEVEFAGHKFHMLRFDIEATIGNGFFEATGTVSVFWEGGEISSTTVTWQQSEGVTVDGYLDLAAILQGNVHATIDPNNGFFRSYSQVSVVIPERFEVFGAEIPVPLIGGKSFANVGLAWKNWDIGFEVGAGWAEWLALSTVLTVDPESESCNSCWKSGRIPFTPLRIGVQCNLDELLAKTLNISSLSSKGSYPETFYVPEGRPFILVRLDGVDGSIPYLELVDPNGVVITPQIASHDPTQYVYSENPAIGEAWIAVRLPTSGIWTFQVPQTELQALATGKDTLAVQAFGALPPPTIDITDPSLDTTTTETVDISWQGASAIADAAVDLYYTSDMDYAGVLVASELPVSGSYSWNVHGTAPGIYYVYGVIDDGRSAPKNAFAQGTVTIEKDPPQADLQGASQVFVGDEVVLDAANSIDPWGIPLDYEWTMLDVPAGSGAGLIVSSQQYNASFVPDIFGNYQIQLCVTDPFGREDCAQITVQAVSNPVTLSVPQVGTISFVGNDFALVATVTDQVDSPVSNETVHFGVISGPHVGTGTTVVTDLAGKAGFVYTGVSDGIDTIQVWSGADTFDAAEDDLRSEIGHVWIPDSNGDCINQNVDLTPAAWHMITLPGEVCGECGIDGTGDLVCALGDDLDPCYIFQFNPATGGYVMAPPTENIPYHPGMGFWVRTYEDNITIDADVQVPTQQVEVALANGWNQVGNPFTFSVPVSELEVNCDGTQLPLVDAQGQGWVSAYLFGYDPLTGGYTMIDPSTGCSDGWQGYWLRTYVDDCTLIIPPTVCTSSSPSSAPMTSKQLREKGFEAPPDPPKISLMGQQVVNDLSVCNIPNPIRSEHTTTFKVEGKAAQLVQGIRVEIYNQAGQKVFTQDINAKELEWHTDNDMGELLANGVYLYQVWVNIGGSWYPTDVQKLAVVR
jgi:hypothetical protein